MYVHNHTHSCTHKCITCTHMHIQYACIYVYNSLKTKPHANTYTHHLPIDCGGCLSHGSMACTLMCVHCGQLSEVTRPHPCVGCGGIISNTLEAFLYYENSICLSCYTGAEALHIQNEVSCTSNEAVCLCVSTTTIITSIDSCAICVYISNTLIGPCFFVPTFIQLLLTAVQFCGTQLKYH